jgi:hypothetical protein
MKQIYTLILSAKEFLVCDRISAETKPISIKCFYNRKGLMTKVHVSYKDNASFQIAYLIVKSKQNYSPFEDSIKHHQKFV